MKLVAGSGWKALVEELDDALRRLEPPGELVEVGVDASGLPSFRIRVDRRVKADGRRLVREYQSRALELCEACGGPGRVRAGAIVTMRCDHCV